MPGHYTGLTAILSIVLRSNGHRPQCPYCVASHLLVSAGLLGGGGPPASWYGARLAHGDEMEGAGMTLRERIGIDLGGRRPIEEGLAWAGAHGVRYLDVCLEAAGPAPNAPHLWSGERVAAVRDAASAAASISACTRCRASMWRRQRPSSRRRSTVISRPISRSLPRSTPNGSSCTAGFTFRRITRPAGKRALRGSRARRSEPSGPACASFSRT